jgi:hypothetical protein
MIGGRMLEGAARHLIGEFFCRFAISLGGATDASNVVRPWRTRLGRFFGAGR